MPRKYRKPPVTEAVCEFRFASTQPWDLTIPGLLFKEISEEFPVLEQTNVMQIVAGLPFSSTAPIPAQVQPSVRFLTPERTELIQAAPHMLSIHQLRPYGGWEHFKTRISRTLEIYVALSKAEELSRVGLRYVDHVELPPGRYELDDYFRVMPRVPEPIPQIFQTFLTQVQIPYGANLEQPERYLRITFGTALPEQPEHFAFALDMDMFTPDGAVPSLADVLNWLQTAHEQVEQAFDAAFTEKTHKEVFEEEVP